MFVFGDWAGTPVGLLHTEPPFHFFHGAQLARMVKPLMGPKRHASFENFLGRLKTFLFEDLTHFLFLGPAFRQLFI
jgi:hypothetical protein